VSRVVASRREYLKPQPRDRRDRAIVIGRIPNLARCDALVTACVSRASTAPRRAARVGPVCRPASAERSISRRRSLSPAFSVHPEWNVYIRRVFTRITLWTRCPPPRHPPPAHLPLWSCTRKDDSPPVTTTAGVRRQVDLLPACLPAYLPARRIAPLCSAPRQRRRRRRDASGDLGEPGSLAAARMLREIIAVLLPQLLILTSFLIHSGTRE